VWTQPARSSPFDLFISVHDHQNVSIQQRASVTSAVAQAVATVHYWDPAKWRRQMAQGGWPAERIDSVLTAKSHFFWEQLAEQVSWRVLRGGAGGNASAGAPAAPIYILGPSCVNASGAIRQSCTLLRGAPDAARITVTTHVDGARDDLMPVRSAATSPLPLLPPATATAGATDPLKYH
jgi:hypothetical protein